MGMRGRENDPEYPHRTAASRLCVNTDAFENDGYMTCLHTSQANSQVKKKPSIPTHRLVHFFQHIDHGRACGNGEAAGGGVVQ